MNIAEAQKKIKELTAEYDSIYSERLKAITVERSSLYAFIRTNCKHHEDMLIVTEEVPEDEYERDQPSWTKYSIVCSICNKTGTVNKTSHLKSGKTFSEVLRDAD